MNLLLEKLGLSVTHLQCLDETFSRSHREYKRINRILNSKAFREIYSDISRELYAGGKQPLGHKKLARQMILGDVIEYIFTGRAYYYAVKSAENFSNFLRLILYSVNQLLIYDTISVDPSIRRKYISLLEKRIPKNILYEKSGDDIISRTIKQSEVVIWTKEWTQPVGSFIDSLLPKTLGCPKELVVFAELIRSRKGIIIPLLLIQRIFSERNPIAPPDFIIIKNNKEMFGIEVGYEKEGQSREFSIRTSIPTFAVDLQNNMHNRCPKCGENILYCDPVIEAYSNGSLEAEIARRGEKFFCKDCVKLNQGECAFSNYYGPVNGTAFNGNPLEEKKSRHYHSACILNDHYLKRKNKIQIRSKHINDFFAQVPIIQGLENL